MAYIGIKYCWNAETTINEGNTWFSFAALLILFLLPIIDTTIVTVNRLRKGQSPFVGGKDHTTHNLSYLGISDRQVAIIYAIVSGVSVVIFLLLIAFGDVTNYYLLGFCILYFVAVCLFLFGITEYNLKRNPELNPEGKTITNS